ncbi:hypothetical protein GOBAR_DD32102 [Gossypium barbadense]|nr:hypothetical protein GOBAR_DD32102 [Gossypium barbadense]
MTVARVGTTGERRLGVVEEETKAHSLSIESVKLIGFRLTWPRTCPCVPQGRVARKCPMLVRFSYARVPH